VCSVSRAKKSSQMIPALCWSRIHLKGPLEQRAWPGIWKGSEIDLQPGV
jgi:hypothetical protein